MALALPCYHVLELRDAVPEEVWREHMAMEELELGDEACAEIRRTMRELREG